MSAEIRTRWSCEQSRFFSDGTSEDVTVLTNFSTNDESVAAVDIQGKVIAVASGDTSIVASFGGAVVTMQVIVPVSVDGTSFPEIAANSQVDRLVIAKLKKVGIKPSALSSDDVFLRRVYLDVIGTLPTSAEVRQFLADPHPQKRSKLIDSLLDRPEYGMYWATKFSDWTGNDNRFTPQPRAKTGWLWHDWLRDKLDRNVPYDELVGGFLTATTREGRSVDDVVAEFNTISKNLSDGFDDGTYASRKTNDIFLVESWEQQSGNCGNAGGVRFSGCQIGLRPDAINIPLIVGHKRTFAVLWLSFPP